VDHLRPPDRRQHGHLGDPPDGSREWQVTNTDDWQEGAPFFMPDSDHIIFRAWRKADYKKIKPTPMTIFSIRRDGSDWRRHTYDDGMNWHPTPAPDGRHYVFVKCDDADELGDLPGGPRRRRAPAADVLRQDGHPGAGLAGRQKDELGPGYWREAS
jgi:hypothetical protein